MSTNLRSLLLSIRPRRTPSKKSPWMCRSWTSSTITTSYHKSSGSVDSCRRSRPSVRKRIFVTGVRLFSKRTCVIIRKKLQELYNDKYVCTRKLRTLLTAAQPQCTTASYSKSISLTTCIGMVCPSLATFYELEMSYMQKSSANVLSSI